LKQVIVRADSGEVSSLSVSRFHLNQGSCLNATEENDVILYLITPTLSKVRNEVSDLANTVVGGLRLYSLRSV
jgi:hypothetical protein